MHGIPKIDGEYVVSIVQTVCRDVGVDIDETGFDACHRRKGKAESTRHLGMVVDIPVYRNDVH